VRDYSRLDATAFTRDRVAGTSVLVVGAGALGNEAIKNLALLGVGRLGILDRDRIEASNLTRSILFCTPDIGRHLEQRTPKAELAAARAMEINPDVRATPFVREIADLGSGVLREFDLVFSCLDNEMARLELGWVCTRLNKPLVDGGLGMFNPSSGLVSIFPGSDGPCYACRKGAPRRRELLQDLQGREDSCGVKERQLREQGIVATTPTLASIVAAFQVELGIRYLFKDIAIASLQGLSYRIALHPQVVTEKLTFERSPNCPLHDAASVVRDVVERPDRASDSWTAKALLTDSGAADGFLTFDWPLTARAECRSCRYAWEPLVRRARFRTERCPGCGGDDLVEIETLIGVSAESPWADRSLSALGLPAGHVHEVLVHAKADSSRRHVEVTGDLAAGRSRSAAS
jgi:molybdopterin/thiamine biosynthesis adenylyltransferase